MEARAPEAASRYSVEVPAYAPAGARSAAAEFVERSDPPKIRVVVRKRPLNQKVRGSGCTGCLEHKQVCSKGHLPQCAYGRSSRMRICPAAYLQPCCAQLRLTQLNTGKLCTQRHRVSGTVLCLCAKGSTRERCAHKVGPEPEHVCWPKSGGCMAGVHAQQGARCDRKRSGARRTRWRWTWGRRAWSSTSPAPRRASPARLVTSLAWAVASCCARALLSHGTLHHSLVDQQALRQVGSFSGVVNQNEPCFLVCYRAILGCYVGLPA